MLKRIEKDQWQRYFDRVSAALGAKAVDIDLVGPHLGIQHETHSMALTGLSYDRKDDIFAIVGEALEHNIAHPREIHVDEELDGLRSLEVVDQAGEHHIVKLKGALRLPPPAH